MIGRGPALLEAEKQRPTLKESGEFGRRRGVGAGGSGDQ